MPARADHVVLIDIDALNSGYLESTDTPAIDALVRTGTRATARGVFKSYSNPARFSIVTGAWPSTHRNQAYYYDTQRDLVLGQERPYEDPAALPMAAETIAEVLSAEARPVVGIDYRNLEGYGLDPGDPKRLYAAAPDDHVARVEAAIAVLRGEPVDSRGSSVVVPRPPDLLAVYIQDVDHLGHAEGPDSPRMPHLIHSIDHQIGRLVEAVTQAGIADRTVFVLLSDHGMVPISEPILPDLLRELTGTSLEWEVVPVGGSPAPETEIVIVATSRNADLTLRGAAAGDGAPGRVAAAARTLGDRVVVHDQGALDAMGAVDRIGQLVVEAVPPYHLSADIDRPAAGSHGGAAEMCVPLVFSGPAIRPGAAADDPRIVDIAPTVCDLLGVRHPAQCEGRAMVELFAD